MTSQIQIFWPRSMLFTVCGPQVCPVIDTFIYYKQLKCPTFFKEPWVWGWKTKVPTDGDSIDPTCALTTRPCCSGHHQDEDLVDHDRCNDDKDLGDENFWSSGTRTHEHQRRGRRLNHRVGFFLFRRETWDLPCNGKHYNSICRFTHLNPNYYFKYLSYHYLCRSNFWSIY